jgi:hypothetical protein
MLLVVLPMLRLESVSRVSFQAEGRADPLMRFGIWC